MPRDLDWDGCRNVRDLGGFTTPAGTTAFGVFVRSDNARELTPAGWNAARAYGIRAVLDLRSDPECAADPPARPEFTHKRLSLFDHFDGDEAYRADLLPRSVSLDDAGKHRLLYREALALDGSRFAQAVGFLADADGGVLFHCAGGKDRTGVLAALLLRLVGVSMADVEADYVRSQARLRMADGTPPGVIDRVIEEIEAKFQLGGHEGELLITVPEAARRLGIGRSHVYRYIDDGRLRSIRLGRSRRIAPMDLAAFVDRVRTSGSA